MLGWVYRMSLINKGLLVLGWFFCSVVGGFVWVASLEDCDLWEGYNWVVFIFNDIFDFYVFCLVVIGYDCIMFNLF